jgi:hypothetical protein
LYAIRGEFLYANAGGEMTKQQLDPLFERMYKKHWGRLAANGWKNAEKT